MMNAFNLYDNISVENNTDLKLKGVDMNSFRIIMNGYKTSFNSNAFSSALGWIITDFKYHNHLTNNDYIEISKRINLDGIPTVKEFNLLDEDSAIKILDESIDNILYAVDTVYNKRLKTKSLQDNNLPNKCKLKEDFLTVFRLLRKKDEETV